MVMQKVRGVPTRTTNILFSTVLTIFTIAITMQLGYLVLELTMQ